MVIRLSSIAQRYETSVEILAAANNLVPPYEILAGDVLRIQSRRQHALFVFLNKWCRPTTILLNSKMPPGMMLNRHLV